MDRGKANWKSCYTADPIKNYSFTILIMLPSRLEYIFGLMIVNVCVLR